MGVSTTFEEGAERNKALGIWGAVAGSGAAVGVLLGGVLTEYLGWEWIFSPGSAWTGAGRLRSAPSRSPSPASSFQQHLTSAQASTVVDEYSRGFWVGFAIALAGVAATLSMIREKDIPAERLEEARVPA